MLRIIKVSYFFIVFHLYANPFYDNFATINRNNYNCQIINEAGDNCLLINSYSNLYGFQGDSDGYGPLSLIMHTQEKLYGITEFGGSISNRGTVIELSQDNFGNWHKQSIYEFQGDIDGYSPVGTLIIDTNSNLYGITE